MIHNEHHESINSSSNIAPRPFKEIPGLWLQLNQMTEEFFINEQSRTSAANTFYSVLIFAILSAIFSAISLMFGGFLRSVGSSTEISRTDTFSIIGGMTVYLFCFTIIMTPISFYFINGIMFLAALIFGGKGSYNAQSYLISLFYVPIGILGHLFSLLSTIPSIGVYIGILVFLVTTVFNWVFTVRVFKIVHNFSTGKAVVAILSPVLLLLIPVCLIVILAIMGPMIGDVFSSMVTPMP